MEMNLQCIPLIPMRGMVVFPYMTLNFDAGRDVSVKALEAAVRENSLIFLVAQKKADKENPGLDDMHVIGTVAKIKQVMNMPGGVTRVVVGGIRRGAIRELVSEQPYFKAVVEEFDEYCDETSQLGEAYKNRLKKAYEEYFTQNPKLNAEHYMSIMEIENIGRLCDMVASGVELKLEVKQELLEELDIYKRIEKLIAAIHNRIQIMQLERKISHRVKERIDKNQKEYYLREQLRVIQDELGDREGIGEDVKSYNEKIDKIKASKNVKDKLRKEVERFSKMQPQSAESGVLRNYLDTVLELPWNKTTRETFDISDAARILDEDHYGLEKVKERILEYLSVRRFTGGKNGTILCLAGPPGVGKTSVSKSIARALNRKYVRVSLGGIHDEADIRGHRKTYIGAMEGRIMAAVKEAKVKNPLILLDEVDKMGVDYKGDPSAALLEVLDYEQNGSFRDHYIEVPFDLSQVMFITTANTLDTVSRPLLDRMEVIELSSYTDEEKFNIAKNYLVKKSLDKTGLTEKQFSIADTAIRDIITYYTREAGVRRLERQIEALCRKAAKAILESGKKSVKITSKNLEDYLGKRRYHIDMMDKSDQVGVVRGLAWTEAGGTTLSVEVNVMAGSGKIELTGKLGDVMKESAKAAISYIRSRADDFNISGDFHEKKDIHIHVPEGAVPKDGPSAGITMATALVSALTEKPVRNDVAMTGEITLRGRVLPIGGLKEKSLAAYQAGIKDIIIPAENRPDIDDIPKEIRSKLNFITADNMDAVLKNALR